ncbi:hypothetical protein PEC302107_17950 [Pectobacterium araliae]|uniref:Uncharacterized protein n=1 Tax=Pectobacterium araliae TaxID=3073862 RepID=A0AAN0KB71_9GAMM|nr:hypothetical protein PEC302110_11370 [Pectobacterium sp. MAFF 302110]GKW20066.1 hypothetical protein PEC302107_17950 [Pectobacterium carotovorum subsp. carotovorum]
MKKIFYLVIPVMLCFYSRAWGESKAPVPGMCSHVEAVPNAVRKDYSLSAFYHKYVDANGIPVLSSDAPEDKALLLACKLIVNMTSHRSDILAKLQENHVRFAVIGKNEGTADIPEYGYQNAPPSKKQALNDRARGLGGQTTSCGEENLLCSVGDRYPNESICVHEFGHSLPYALNKVEPDFLKRLKSAFNDAHSNGLLIKTYRDTNMDEYWAEGVQDWYNTNAKSDPPNGIHNKINTRQALKTYDPKLYSLIAEALPKSTDWGDCHVKP